MYVYYQWLCIHSLFDGIYIAIESSFQVFFQTGKVRKYFIGFILSQGLSVIIYCIKFTLDNFYTVRFAFSYQIQHLLTYTKMTNFCDIILNAYFKLITHVVERRFRIMFAQIETDRLWEYLFLFQDKRKFGESSDR